MTISRRTLLKGGLAAVAGAFALGGAGGTLSRVLADGSARAPRRLFIVFANGGWDTTVSIDPKPNLATIDVVPGNLRRFGDIPVWSSPVRPSVDAFFARYGDRASVVHGIEVRSFVHTDCTTRMLSGTASDSAPDIAALTADCLGRDRPVPYLVLGGVALSGDLGSLVGRVGSTNQLLALTDPEQAYPDLLGANAFPRSAAEESLLSSFRAASSARFEALRGQRASNAARVQEFLGADGRAQQLSRFVQESGFGTRELVADPATQIAVGIEALSTDLSQSVMVNVGGFDTHQNNLQQSVLQENLYRALTGLMEGLDEAGIGDETAVVVMSEMGRTPLLNGTNGKDHWPVASAIVLGPDVNGGRTVGRTDDNFQSVSIDLATGEEGVQGASRIQVGNFAAGILEMVGVDASERFPNVEPLRAFVRS